MTKLDEIQEYRKMLQKAEDNYETLLSRYSVNLNVVDRMNIFLLNKIIDKVRRDVEEEINKIRERED
jgi:uncharacterized protein YPO0396